MNTLEKLTAIARMVPNFDNPLAKVIRMQQDIAGQMQQTSAVGNMGALAQLTVIAKSSPMARLSALSNFKDASIFLPKNVSALTTLKAFDLSVKMQAKVLGRTLISLNSASLLESNYRILNTQKHLTVLGKAGILPMLATIPPNTMSALGNMPIYQTRLNALGLDIVSKYSGLAAPLTALRSIYPDTMQSTLKALSLTLNRNAFRLATTAAIGRQWEAIDELDELLNETIELTEALVDNDFPSEGESSEFVRYIQSMLKLLGHHLASDKSLILNILTLIGHIMAFHQYADFIKPKPELATKEDWQEVKRDYQDFKLTLSKQVQRATVVHKCPVYLKPNSKSTKLAKLTIDQEVEILDTNSRWLHISFNDEQDNYPITGWVLKKYLQKLPDKK